MGREGSAKRFVEGGAAGTVRIRYRNSTRVLNETSVAPLLKLLRDGPASPAGVAEQGIPLCSVLPRWCAWDRGREVLCGLRGWEHGEEGAPGAAPTLLFLPESRLLGRPGSGAGGEG